MRLLQHPSRPGSRRPGPVWFLGAIAGAFAWGIAPADAQTAPVDEEEPIRIRRIADAEGRPVNDARQTAARSGGGPSTDTFDPLEVRRVDLQAIEASIGDRGALDLSLRWIDPGLRLPTGYDQVYARSGGGFWRANGGLVARFDQSVYVPTQYGPIPDIPSSTVFVIGGVPLGGEVGHGRLLAVDPLDPGLVPPLSGPVSVPDEWHTPSAVPGDRFARFGFGPGYRVPVRTGGEASEVAEPSSRFQRDAHYRASRLSRMLSHWRTAAPANSKPDGSNGRTPPSVSPERSDSEAVPPSPAREGVNPDRAS